MKAITKLYDDDNHNIEGILCGFLLEITTQHHRLDGVCGVSGSEMRDEDRYYIKNKHKILGYYDSNTGYINEIDGSRYSLNDTNIELINIKIVNKQEILNQLFA